MEFLLWRLDLTITPLFHEALQTVVAIRAWRSSPTRVGKHAHYQQAHTHGPLTTEGGDYAAGALSVAVRGCALPLAPQTSCAVLVRCGPCPLPSAQACATGEKLKCAQPQPQEADPLQVRNPS